MYFTYIYNIVLIVAVLLVLMAAWITLVIKTKIESLGSSTCWASLSQQEKCCYYYIYLFIYFCMFGFSLCWLVPSLVAAPKMNLP